MTCTEGLCHHGIRTLIGVHTCEHGPTRYPLAYDRESPKGKDLGEGPRSRNMLLKGSTHTGKGLGNTAKAAGFRTRVGPSPRQEENRIQYRKAGKANQLWPRPWGRGARLACLQNPVIAEALGQEDTLGTTGLNLLGDTEWQGLERPSGVWP